MRRLAPLFRETIEAATASPELTNVERVSVGKTLLSLMHDEVVGHLEYHRAWLLKCFTEGPEWNSYTDFVKLYNTFSDSFTKASSILALGQAKQAYWFRQRKHDLDQFGPWERRAFLYGASCLPQDEADYWYAAVKRHLDDLEQSVVTYARRNPLR
jgi:hypothetical protein